jgi:hypothetical protein
MKACVYLGLLFAACGWAGEAADRSAIRQTIGSAQFTADADGKSQLEAAMHAPRRDRPPSEPLSADYWPFWPSYLEKPWPLEVTSIRFITADVALADARVNHRALLFVLKKEESGWKIASVRFLLP